MFGEKLPLFWRLKSDGASWRLSIAAAAVWNAAPDSERAPIGSDPAGKIAASFLLPELGAGLAVRMLASGSIREYNHKSLIN